MRMAFGRPFSMKALDACFRLAIIYASCAMIFAPSYDQISKHPKQLLFLAAIGATGFYGARWLRRRAQSSVDADETAGRGGRRRLLESGAYVVITAVLLAATALGAPWIAVATVSLGAALGARLAFAAPASVVAFAAGGGMNHQVGGALFVYLAMFPCLNALFHWPSWAASRWQMKRLRRDAARPPFPARVGRLFGHVLADALIAVACLFALAATIAIMSETNRGVMLWGETLSKAQHAPFSGDGLVLTLMLFSTLVPTAIHLFFAIFALAFVETPYRGIVARFLEDEQGGQEWANQAIVAVYLTAWATFSLVVI